MTERRPHLQRKCPLAEQMNCDWVQVTSWYVGGPDNKVPVSDTFLRMEAEAHLEAHYGIQRTIYT